MSTYSQAIEFFKGNEVDLKKFDYFDYADFIEHLDT